MSWKKHRQGFTLLEVLLAIVLIGTAWAVFAFNIDSLMDKDPLHELERSFVHAQTEGRMLAFEKRKRMELAWDEKGNRFVLLDQSVVSSFPVEGLVDEETKLKVTFYFQEASYKGDSFEDIGWYEVPSVMFYGDATSAPFKVVLEHGDRSRELMIEPFTGFVSQSS
ncbi:MAG: prepilin-type N-terminal cleavage/methylation domain-containing protein [Verrucomicrobiae bacterium]|nr:prepilin-type N-terminal cleavage/methylation domain-containing protein [Verrucomicrobiae bacterium]